MPPESQNNFQSVNNAVQLEPPRKHTRLILLTFIMILAGVLAIGYFWYQSKKTSVPVENQNLAVASSTDRFVDWKTYRNEEYGFELTFNDNWKGYKAETLRDVDGNAIVFCLPTNNKNYPDSLCDEKDIYNGYASLFVIGISTRSQWNQWSQELRAPIFREKDNLVFTSTKAQDNPDDVLQQYDEIDKILSTFKFIQLPPASISTPTLFTGADWKEISFDTTKPFDFQLAYDNFNYIQEPAKRKQKIIQLPGRLWMSDNKNLSDSQLNTSRDQFQKYYEDSLKSLGWDWEQNIDDRQISFQGPSADGPLGSVWGYVKIQGGKLGLIGLSYQITDYTDVSNGGPIQIKCPCTLELKVFVSDEADINQFTL